MQTEQLLYWSGMTTKHNSTTFGLNEKEGVKNSAIVALSCQSLVYGLALY